MVGKEPQPIAQEERVGDEVHLVDQVALQEPAQQDAAALEQEVAQLREQANTAAGVISALAEQNARLVEAVDLLRVRTRILMAACGVLAVALVAVFLIR